MAEPFNLRKALGDTRPVVERTLPAPETVLTVTLGQLMELESYSSRDDLIDTILEQGSHQVKDGAHDTRHPTGITLTKGDRTLDVIQVETDEHGTKLRVFDPLDEDGPLYVWRYESGWVRAGWTIVKSAPTFDLMAEVRKALRRPRPAITAADVLRLVDHLKSPDHDPIGDDMLLPCCSKAMAEIAPDATFNEWADAIEYHVPEENS